IGDTTAICGRLQLRNDPCLVIKSENGHLVAGARAAASAAVDLLGPRDQVAVLAFDDQTWVISELQPAANRSRIADQIGRIQPGGGTNMFPAMESAFETLNSASL
ncbi:MAG: VWA domain-containing protein, partial [Planctomycetaceae bacterium]